MRADEIREIPRINEAINADIERLAYLKEKVTCLPSSLSNTDIRIQISRHDHTIRYIEAIVDLKNEINAYKSKLVMLQEKIEVLIRQLPEKTETDILMKKVMTYRYIDCMKWQDIADLLYISKRHAHRVEVRGLYLITNM